MNTEMIMQAARGTLAGTLLFPEVVARLLAAGVQGYFDFLRGQRITCLGRGGDQHTEGFPGANPTALAYQFRRGGEKVTSPVTQKVRILKDMAQTTAKSRKQARPRKTAARRPAKSGRGIPTEPTAQEIAARKAVARTFFNPVSAAAARGAFLKRQQAQPDAG